MATLRRLLAAPVHGAVRRVTVWEDSPTALAAYAAVRAEMATRGVELQLVDAAALPPLSRLAASALGPKEGRRT